MTSTLSRLVRLLRSLAVRAGQATFRFPAAAAAICAIAAIANWAVAHSIDGVDPLARVLLALTAGAAASVSATLFAESRGAGLGVGRLAGLAGLALMGLAVGFARPFLLNAPALTIAIVAAVPLSPFLGRGSSREFWDFTLWTALGVTLGWFSVLIFLLGFTAIFEMIRTLFGVGLGADAYAHLFATGLTLVGPLFALGRIPHPQDVLTEDSAGDRLARAVRPLFVWVTAPLVLVAGVIIHVYAVRIVVTGDVPANEIGWLVLLFSAFVLSLRVGLEPYEDGLPQPARVFARRWAAMLVVPLALFAYALALRVGAQGWTVERYFAAAYALAAALAVAMQAVPRLRSDVRAIVAVLPVVLALTTFGPWGVADTVGRSQAALIGERYGDVLERGAEAARGLDGPARYEILSRMDALEEVEALDRLGPRLASIGSGEAVARAAALRSLLAEGEAQEALVRQQREQSFSTDDPWDVGGYDRVFPPLNAVVADDGAATAIRLVDGQLVVSYRGQTDRFALASALPAPATAPSGSSLPALVLDLRSDGGRSIRFRVTHARWNADGVPVFLQGWLALRHGEWASLR